MKGMTNLMQRAPHIPCSHKDAWDYAKLWQVKKCKLDLNQISTKEPHC